MLHQAVLAAMHKFNRIFHRDDVVVPLEVGVIHHRRQSRGFAGTGRAGHQDQSFFQHRKFFQDWREAEIFHRQDRRWNQTKDRRDAIFLLEEITAVAGHSWHLVAKIDVGSFFEDFDFSFGSDLVNHRLQLIILERWIIDADQLAVDAKHGRVVRGEMKVRSLLFAH